jgi:glycosyltransferase involved in cell wall biosynthesis
MKFCDSSESERIAFERAPVRILVQVHTWNDADVIGALLDAIQRQNFAVTEILIVDNASTDGTAELAYPSNVRVIRHRSNLGTSGSVAVGAGCRQLTAP